MDVSVAYLRPNPKTGILEFRHVFPEHLRPFVHEDGEGRYELKVSIGARSITEPGAMERFAAAERRYEAMKSRAQKMLEGRFDVLDGPEIAYLVERYRERELAADAAGRFDPDVKVRGNLVTTAAERAGYDLPSHRPAARWQQGVRFAVEAALEVYREYYADGDLVGIVEAWAAEATSLASSRGLVVDQSSPGFQDLCIRLNEAAISVHEAELERMDGKVIPTPVAPEPPKRQSRTSGAGSRTFEAIILALLDAPTSEYSEPTRESVRGALRFLREAVGTPTPAELTREMVSTFLDLLAQRPAKLPKEDLALELPALVAKYRDRPEVKRLGPKTLEKYNNALNARWKEAQDRGIPKALPSPFGDRSEFRRLRSAPKRDMGFTADELRAYFSLAPFQRHERPVRGKGEAIYWLPLLLLFTGARPEEVAQLLVEDIQEANREGRWLIRFTDQGVHPEKGQQRLKSAGRMIPAPNALLDLGLADYLGYLKSRDELALFPLLRRKGKRGNIYPSFGEWFGPYLYSQGVLVPDGTRQPVREFRHTWATAARASGIYREAMEYIQGHGKPEAGTANDTYGTRSPLGDQIDRLVFEVDIVNMVQRWRPPSAAFRPEPSTTSFPTRRICN